VVGWTLSLLLARHVETLHATERDAQITERARQRYQSIERELYAAKEVLSSVAAFFASRDEVSRDEFRAFTRSSLARHPSLLAVEWVPAVSAEARADFERRATLELGTKFQLTERSDQGERIPVGPRAEYFPVYFVEPMARNLAALGFDLGSEADRMHAMREAERHDRITASGPVALVQDPGRESGVIFFAPVSDRDDTFEASRFSTTRGYVLAVIRVRELLESHLIPASSTRLSEFGRFEIEVFDESGTSPELVARISDAIEGAGDEAQERSLPVIHRLDVGGRRWAVVDRSLGPQVAGGPSNAGAYFLAAGGLLVSLLAASMFGLRAERLRGIEETIRTRTSALQDTNRALVSEVAHRRSTESDLKQHIQLFEMISQFQSRYIGTRRADIVGIFDELLEGILKLTSSEFGFIGEVLLDDAGEPYLRTYAVTNISWDQTSRELYSQTASSGIEFRNLDNLFGATIRSGDVVISDCPAQDPRSRGLPEGHPALACFLGVPVYCGKSLVGMVGLANRPDGYTRDLVRFLEPLTSTFGNIVAALRELKARRAVERALSESEARTRAILDSAADAIITIDERGTVEDCNPACEAAFGYTKSELIGKNVSKLMPSPDRDRHDTYLASYLQTGTARVIGIGREVHGLRKDGSVFPVDLVVSEAKVAGGRIFSGIVRDISERKRMERERRISDERYRDLVESASDLIYEVSSEGLFTFANPTAVGLTGYSMSEIVGMHYLSVVHPDWRERVKAFYARQTRDLEPTTYFEFEIVSKAGERVWLGQHLKIVRYDDQVTGARAVARDISEKKRVERMKEEFISVMNHELRTPLTAIKGSLGLIQSGAMGEIPEEVGSLVETSSLNCERVSRIVDDILDLERVGAGAMEFRMETHEVGGIIRDAVLANGSYAERFGVQLVATELAEDCWAEVDRDRLVQVLTNLLSNACKFSPEGSAVVVRMTADPSSLAVMVDDQGPGIPRDFQSKIFGRFAQADASDARRKGGTGLGLAISKELVEHMQGSIGFNDREGGGTTFFFVLPRIEPKVEF